MPIEEAAARAGTIQYELLCAISEARPLGVPGVSRIAGARSARFSLSRSGTLAAGSISFSDCGQSPVPPGVEAARSFAHPLQTISPCSRPALPA